MSLEKIKIWLLTALTSLLALYGCFYYPSLSLFIIIILSFSLLTFKKPHWAFYLLLSLPILGEYSRFEIFSRSIIASDLLIPLFLLICLFNKQISFKFNKTFFTTLLLFLLIAFISILISLTALSTSEVLTGSLYLIRLISYLLLFPVTFKLFRSEDKQKELLTAIAIISILIASTGFLQLLLMPNLELLAKTQGYDPHINRLVGSWLDPNFIGGFFAFIITLFAGIGLYSAKTTKTKLLFGLFLIILTAALFLTYSRSAYLALAAGAFVLGLLKSRKLILTLIIIGLLGVSISDRAQQRLAELTTSITSVIFNTAENPDPTARLRIINWEQTISLIQQKPLLGHGYNNLAAVKTQAGFVADESIHSASGSDASLLTIAATTGLLGFMLFLFIIIQILFKSFITWLNSKNKYTQGFALGFFAAFLGLLVHSNFVNSFLFPQIMIYLWPFLAILFLQTTKDTSSPT